MTSEAKEWAGTTEDIHDLHRFGPGRTARCNPSIRTHSRTTDHDTTREPYATLRTPAEIVATGFTAGRHALYRFCPDCTVY
ncbi:hypothetical protein ACH4UY_37565 [Streptomyces longwoodensis]|uniref:hypothetical protein n=1 Tax=Streptomyces longwoodensis TaxID=68231 RepID=UPI0037942E7E